MTNRIGAEVLEWISYGQGVLHDAASHATGLKIIDQIGLGKTVFFNTASKWLDDLELSNEDLRSIVGSGAGSYLGVAGTSAAVGLLGSGPIDCSGGA